MQIKLQKSENILIASAFGELDHHGAAAVRKEIDDALDAYKFKHLIFDVEKVSFMDSSGIGVVMGRYKKIAIRQGKLYLSGCSPFIEKILDMAGIFSITGKAASIEEAIAVIKGQEQLGMEAVINE